MKFQDSSFNGLKVIEGTKKCDPRTHPRTHAPKAICPVNFFKVGGIITPCRRCAAHLPEPGKVMLPCTGVVEQS